MARCFYCTGEVRIMYLDSWVVVMQAEGKVFAHKQCYERSKK